MISSAELELLLQSSFIFRRSLLPDRSNREILADFENLLRDRENGAWLVRESRSLGNLSLSYRKNDTIRHYRFALVDGVWTGSDSVSAGQSVKCVDLSNLGEQGQKLIKLIIGYGFSRRRMVLPNDLQCTQEPDYMRASYSSAKILSRRYDDPVVAVKEALERLKVIDCNEESIVQTAGSLKKPLDSKAGEEVDEAFAQWLRNNELDTGLICSVSLSLIREPLVLHESGRSFDASSMPMIGARCPITRAPITQPPYTLPEYEPLLATCLDIFIRLVNEAWLRKQPSAPGAYSMFASSSTASSVPVADSSFSFSAS
ncbi:SH2 domain-containing protein [Legionella sp. CNM-4043-24]|uniref:SH2 domain-containing protein n=1 Tax=Legionella sp. CNM-4043-24 TaxID=3421646 RepID=UPI00403B3268